MSDLRTSRTPNSRRRRALAENALRRSDIFGHFRTFSDIFGHFRNWRSRHDDPIRSNHSAKAPPRAPPRRMMFFNWPCCPASPSAAPSLDLPNQPPHPFIPSRPQLFRQIPRKSADAMQRTPPRPVPAARNRHVPAGLGPPRGIRDFLTLVQSQPAGGGFMGRQNPT
jgi:hypothetical protein